MDQKTFAPALDDMLTPEQAAQWLGIKERELLAKSRGPKAVIPSFPFGQRTRRYHPRTIIAVAAKRAGIAPEIIAASFGIHIDRPPDM